MGVENPWSAWLSRVRQAGGVARTSTALPSDRANQFLDTICDGNQLHATLLWAIDNEGKFQAVAKGGVIRIAGPDGKLNIDPATHLEPLKAVFTKEPPPPGPWKSGQGTHYQRALRRLVVAAKTPLVLELFFSYSLANDRAGIELASDEVVALLTKALDAHASSPKVNTLNDEFWRQLDQFSLSLQKSLSVADVSMVAANDGRVLLDCDRVSVAMRYGQRAKIVATSGQESTQQRANLIYQMSQLAKAVCDLGEPVVYTGTTDGFPESFREPLSKYLEESRSRMVHLIPLRENIAHHKTELDLADQRRQKPGRVIACLIAEQSQDSEPLPSVSQRIPMVADHVASALSNARTQESIFLLPLWRTIGRTLGWFRGRRLAIAIGIIAALAGVIAALSVVPWEYRFEAAGRAMPVEQHDLFAPWDGDVIQVLVENGQTVKKGELVFVLRGDDLQTELITAENEASERKKAIFSLEEQQRKAASAGDIAEEARITTEIETTKVQQIGAEAKAEMFRKRIEALKVTSPVDGVVATFQVKQTLLDRPVRRGERLLEIMNVSGPWRLELDAPEYRMGHLQRAIISKSGGGATPAEPALRQKLSPAEQLDVDYIAATAVEDRHHGKLTEIGTRTNESQKEGSTIVELYVDINPNDLPARHIGAEVTAKIHCGKRSLGYVLFGDVWEFIIRKVWW